MDTEITNILLSRLNEIQEDTKQLNNSVRSIDTRLSVMESKQAAHEKTYSNLSQQVAELMAIKNKQNGLLSFFIFLIPSAVALLSILFK